MHEGISKPEPEKAALVEHLNGILPLDDSEKAFIEKLFVPRRIKRRQFIHHEGEFLSPI